MTSKVNFSLKTFVKETSPVSFSYTKLKSPMVNECASDLSGSDARNFYESVVRNTYSETITSSDSLPKFKKIKKSRNISVTISNDIRNSHQERSRFHLCMGYAQDNNVSGLIQCLVSKSINETDDYGWSALMCAACSGAKDAVSYLLKEGADVSICDKAGNNAITLAKKNGFSDIVALLDKTSKHTNKVSGSNEKVLSSHYCTLCKQSFKMSSVKEHESSILHQFNAKPKFFETMYNIPESNKGFQMLLRSGWNKEEGLGQDGSGRKYPLKVVPKNDKYGVGIDVKRIKTITNQKTSKTHLKCKSKKIKETSIQRERNRERKFRMENPTQSLAYLQELEHLGEEILTDRQEIIALDNRRNQNREALRAISKTTTQDKTWLAIGPTLIKMPTDKAKNLLHKDQQHVDAEINKLRSDLKVKVNNLRDLEYKPPVPGLMLQALSPGEMAAVGQVLGRPS